LVAFINAGYAGCSESLFSNMAATLNGVFRKELRDAILSSKVLVVGAGGIGCEILKNLVMSGFTNIEIVSIFFY